MSRLSRKLKKLSIPGSSKITGRNQSELKWPFIHLVLKLLEYEVDRTNEANTAAHSKPRELMFGCGISASACVFLATEVACPQGA